MLFEKGISGVTGFTSTDINQGSLESTGLEVELRANVIKTDNFSWKLFKSGYGSYRYRK